VNLKSGDVGLSRGEDFVDWWIRFAEARRYGKQSREARWNHAFLVVDATGNLIQAEANGIVRGKLSEYAGGSYTILRPPYPTEGAIRAVHAMSQMLGERYNYLEIASLALALLTQTKLRFGIEGTQICSGSVSWALTVGGVDCGEDPTYNTPADLMHAAEVHGWLLIV
jgi:hypothetical protein